MLRRLFLPVVFAVTSTVAVPAVGQDGPGYRDGDTLFDTAGLDAQLSGQVIEFYDGSKSRYRGDGRYSYTYTDNGRPHLGEWQAGDAGEVCVSYDNGTARCDTFVRNDGQLVLITADGARFPVRNRSTLPLE